MRAIRYLVLRTIMRLLTALVLGSRLQVEGLEHVPRRGGVLVVGNHVATVDPPLTGSRIPRLDVHYMAKGEHFARRRVAWLFRAFNAFPVMRGRADREALGRALQILREGHVLLVYPEGSRSWDGRLRRPHAGVGFLARHSGVPVVPVAIWGTERVIPRGGRLPRPADVHLRFGPAVTLPERITSRPDHQMLADTIMRAVAELLPAERRGAFGDAAAGTLDPPAA